MHQRARANGNFVYQKNPGSYNANGARVGATASDSESLNRIFPVLGYTNSPRSSGNPITMDYARFEIFTGFPADACTPHPTLIFDPLKYNHAANDAVFDLREAA